jgi:hypothetical protein
MPSKSLLICTCFVSLTTSNGILFYVLAWIHYRFQLCLQICGERILAPRGMHGALGAARSYSSLVAPFYVFPCEHAFHADCLTDYVIKHTDKSERDRIRGLLRQLTALGNQELPITTGSKTSAETAPADGRPSPIDQLRAQLDDAVAGECPFCGELMIKEIGQAFIGSEDSDLVVSWALP